MTEIPGSARRRALLKLGALCGLALSGDVVAAVTAAARLPDTLDTPGAPGTAFLSRDELALTGVLAELIIPRTDTPGARDVNAHRTVDHLLAACTPAPEQALFRAGLARIDALALAQGGQSFAALPAPRQAGLLHALDNGGAPFTTGDVAFFRQLKAHVAFAYYTSEAGASRELAYLPVPGGFKGQIKITRATRAWAI